LVEYHSSTHKEWLPATIVNRDQEGRVVIDLKPNTWIPLEVQAQMLRPRRMQPQDQRQVATPVRARSPFHNGVPRVMTPGRMFENYNQYPSRQASPPRQPGSRVPTPGRASTPGRGDAAGRPSAPFAAGSPAGVPRLPPSVAGWGGRDGGAFHNPSRAANIAGRAIAGL